MRVRRFDSAPRLEIPTTHLQAQKVNLSLVSSASGSSSSQLSFGEPNPIAEFMNTSGAGETGPGIPGLVHRRIEISESSAAALRQMAHDDPALYGRIVQHLNALDPKKTWTVSLDAWTKESISATQHASFTAQENKSISSNGLGAGGLHTSYFKGLVEYESVEKTKVVSEAKPGNEAQVQAMMDHLKSWNERYASSFEFDHDVGDRVSNPEVSAAALDELATLLNEHAAVLDGASIELAGFTSTSGTDEYNQTLSEQRASTITAMLEGRITGTELEGRVSFSSTGHGETQPLGSDGKPLALDERGRPIDPSLEDPAKSRRVEVKVEVDPLVVEGQPGQTATWREGVGIVLEIKAKPEGGGGSHPPRPDGDDVTKSRISKRIGGEIPCKRWMKDLLRP